MDPTVRKQKSGDQLAAGDWLAPGELITSAAEVLHTLSYPGDKCTEVHLVVRGLGQVKPFVDVVGGHFLFDLASDDDLAELRDQAERARQIADIRAFADWLESNPGAPVPWSFGGQVAPGHEIRPDLDVWNSGAAGMAELRRLAAIMGAEIVHPDDERAVAVKTFGKVEYKAIAWHRDGRTAEPEPAPDPIGLDYSRADGADDPTPVSPARVPMHAGTAVSGIATDGTREGEPDGLVSEIPGYAS